MPHEACNLDTSVPDWIIEHPTTLALLRNLGIDYCCGGKSLEFACRERGLDPGTILTTLQIHLADNSNRSSNEKQ